MDIQKIVADFQVALSSSVNTGDTTATLTSAIDEDGNILASGVYGFTIDNNSPQKEYIIALVVGTTLTNVKSVSRQGVQTTGFSQFHRKGASVEVTNWSALYAIVKNLGEADQFPSGVHIGYDGAPVGLSGNEFATVAYVLSVVSGGTVSFSQQVLSTQTAGENLTALDHVYFKEADARWYKVDADLTATYQQVRHGIALSTATTGNALTIAISGPVTGFVGLTPGSKYYASNTAGAIQATAGTNTVFVGWALSATSLLFDPYGRDIPYGSEKDALAGSVGTPSSTNTYLTQAGMSDGSTGQSQTTQNGTYPCGQASTTARAAKLAQSFVPTKTLIKSVNLNKQANTGTFTGTVTISIQADSAGAPSGTALATKTITNALYNAYATGDFLALFAAETAVTPGSTYWIVIETSTADTANCINLGTNTAGGYASGSVKQYNATDGWAAVATIDLYFKVNQGFTSKAVEASTTGYVPNVSIATPTKVGTLALNNGGVTTLVHGFGKKPSIVRASFFYGTGSSISVARGAYDVANGTYGNSYARYASGNSTGGQDNDCVVRVEDTLNTKIAVSADENVVVFSASAGTSTIAYEIIG